MSVVTVTDSDQQSSGEVASSSLKIGALDFPEEFERIKFDLPRDFN